MTLLAAINQASSRMRNPPLPDALQTVLDGMAAGVWSANIATNTLLSVMERRSSDPDLGTYYAPAGHPSVSVADNNPFSYSSGCYMAGIKKYAFTGGGHNDWLGSEVSMFDMRTLTWTRTDESAKVSQTAAAGVPFQSSDTNGWKAHRNPSGRFAPIASHMYGGMCHMPSLGKIYVQGAAPFNSGTGSVGGSTWIDVASGHWDENGAYAGAPHGGTEGCTYWLPGCVVVNDVTIGSPTPTGQTKDCVLFAWDRFCYLIDPVTKAHVGGVGYWSANGDRGSMGCVIPDPDYPGYLAYVLHASATQFVILHRVNMTDGTNRNNSNGDYKNYGPGKPAGVGNGRWIYMGDYIPGCTKIAVFSPTNGLYALNTTDWTFSSQLVGSPITSWIATGRRIEYLPEYDCFGAFDDRANNFYVLKRPTEFS